MTTPGTTIHKRKSLSDENTFDEDGNNLSFLCTELVRLKKNDYNLRKEGKLTGCVTVKLRYADFETVSKQEVIDYKYIVI
ncbi:MAG: hypothetical protein ICV84_22875 [Flavisolibacter sp.]|nr:hypothetical protein [Flavisolibacter sp.]